MPYECEDCGKMGARMNTLFEIRLCADCSKSFKYKLICKSKALKQYLLTKLDLDNNEDLIQEYLVKNPYYKSGPPMTLYLETQVCKIFLFKYRDIIKKIFTEQNSLNYEIIDDEFNPSDIAKMKIIVSEVSNYLKEQKNIKKQNKYYKILDKYNIGVETDLPEWVQKQLDGSKSVAEYSRILASYFRFVNLHKLLKDEKLVKYLDHKICHNFIYQIDKSIKIEQIPSIIRFMLNKKNLIKQAIKAHKIDKSKYSQEISNYINSFDSETNIKTISNDLEMLIEYINRSEKADNERKLRIKELEKKLKLRGLVLRSDSVLCSNYIEGSNEYASDEIVDIMEQMDWFFTNTPYSTYSKQYDNEQYELRKSDWYNYQNRYYNGYYYDSDNSDNSVDIYYYKSREKSKQEYNKRKSEYVKRKCLKEWITNGKKGTYPQSLIPQIEQLEKEL